MCICAQSTGALPCEQIVELALDILCDKLESLLTETSKLEGFTSEEATASLVTDRTHKDNRHKSTHSQRQDYVLDLT